MRLLGSPQSRHRFGGCCALAFRSASGDESLSGTEPARGRIVRWGDRGRLAARAAHDLHVLAEN
jgi:hypothetical protein